MAVTALGGRRQALSFALDNLVWLILLAALAAFALFIPKFFQIGILLNILEQSTFVGVIAVGLSLTLIAGPDGPVGGIGDGARRDDGRADLRDRRRRRRAGAVAGLAGAAGVDGDGAGGGGAGRRAERHPGGALRDQRLHRDARLLHLGARARGRDVGRAVGLRVAGRDPGGVDPAHPRRADAGLGAGRGLCGGGLRAGQDAVRTASLHDRRQSDRQQPGRDPRIARCGLDLRAVGAAGGAGRLAAGVAHRRARRRTSAWGCCSRRSRRW